MRLRPAQDPFRRKMAGASSFLSRVDKMSKFKVKDARKLRVSTPFSFADSDPRATPCFEGNAKSLNELATRFDEELSDLEELLFAIGHAHGKDAPSILVVLQGIDTSGKGGAAKSVYSVFHPQGTTTS